LSLYSAARFAADMPSRLGALTTLEELSLYSTWGVPVALDVSRLRNLRLLEVIAPSMDQWPIGVLQLPRLERLNLTGTGIRTLPEGIFEGHEKLWSGLSLDWSNVLRKNFKPAYEYLKRQPQHLVDLEEMVRDYCKGELKRLGEGINDPSAGMFDQFVEQWPDAAARFDAVEALSEQHHQLNQHLNDWSQRARQMPGTAHEIMGRTWTANALRTSWRNGAFKRYGSTANASVLDLPNLALSEFPELPDGAFPEVRTLSLKGNGAPVQQIRSFVRGFLRWKTRCEWQRSDRKCPLRPVILEN
jgi:hypothetical protein